MSDIQPVEVGQKITLIKHKSYAKEMHEYYGKDVEVEITHTNLSGHRFWYKAPNGYESFKGEMDSNAMSTWAYGKLNEIVQSYR